MAGLGESIIAHNSAFCFGDARLLPWAVITTLKGEECAFEVGGWEDKEEETAFRFP